MRRGHVAVRTFALSLLALSFGGATRAQEIDWSHARGFWAFRSPTAHPAPAVKDRHWSRQPIDPFILARLESAGLKPAPAADRRTLIRRVTFDLTGLPPTPDEVDAFVADPRADAYERVVARLLDSPRFGERLASLWLTLARYAEDQAHQVGADTKFFYPNAYLYRDWVIEAFNRDLPYDQFIRYQLAADRVVAAQPHDRVALGFLGLGPKYYNRNRLEVMADEWEDRVDTVTRTFLGLTVACARCHDHKFEPITQRDYYALAGIFASTKMINQNPEGKDESGLEAGKVHPRTAHIVEDTTPQDLNVFIRGNVERKGPVVERRFLRVLCDQEPRPFTQGSGRLELAEAVASRANPLTARVFVNRIWSLYFGKPLVATPSNFGNSGARPTHPELLDDLAVRFMERGWSIKTLVRELVTSATYRQASEAPVSNAPAARADPANELLGHMPRRRLTVEQLRDAVLYVSGQLTDGEGPSPELGDPANRRRTVYARVSRLKLDDLLMQFDYPDANVHAEQRSVSTSATQKLFLLNSPFMLSAASALAAQLTPPPPLDDTARIRRAHLVLFAREPNREETQLALAFLRKPATSATARWEQYAQLLLASNAMLYVD